MKATDLLVQCLENEGVEYVFGITGKETNDLMISLSASTQIQFILTRNEQSAAFMAAMYGKVTGKPGVCLATLGPGASNLMTGIATANLDYCPVVAITGQAPINEQHKDSHQYVNLIKMFEPITKWAIQVKHADLIPEIIRRGFRVAQLEKPGAVHIELPVNIAKSLSSEQPLRVTSNPEYVPTAPVLDYASKLIQNHGKPVILTGNGVIRNNASNALREFAEKLQVPVVHSFMGKGALPKDHPLHYGTLGFMNQDLGLKVLDQGDVIITVGYDVIEKLPAYWNSVNSRPIVHINTVPCEVDPNYPAEVELIGDLNISLQALTTQITMEKAWTPELNLKTMIDEEKKMPSEQNQNKLRFIIKQIESVVPRSATILSDVGEHKMEIARYFNPDLPHQLLISNGYASMGIALPGAIGVKLARPSDPVICIVGDGGFMMNHAEIETATRLNTPIIIILIKNGSLQLEKKMMQQQFGKEYGVEFENPDFLELASSFGIKGFRITNHASFTETLQQSLGLNESVLIEVVF